MKGLYLAIAWKTMAHPGPAWLLQPIPTQCSCLSLLWEPSLPPALTQYPCYRLMTLVLILLAFCGTFVTVSWQSCVLMSAVHSLVAHPAVPPSLLPCDTGLNLETVLLKERSTAQVDSMIGFWPLHWTASSLFCGRGGQGQSKWSLCSFFLFSLKGFF